MIQPKLNFTAIGSGYYRVYVNGVEVSKHLQEREAIETAANRVLANLSSVVSYKHDYAVLVTAVSTGVVTPPVDTDPVPETDSPVDPHTDPDPVDPSVTLLANVQSLINAGWDIPNPSEWWIEHPTAAEIKAALIAPFQNDENGVCIKRLWMPHVMATGNYDPSIINAIKNTANAMHRRAIVAWWERDINGNTAASDAAMQQAKNLFNSECDKKIAATSRNSIFAYPLYAGGNATDELTACLTLDWIQWDSPSEFEAAFAKVRTILEQSIASTNGSARNFCKLPGSDDYDGYNNASHGFNSVFHIEPLLAFCVYGVNPDGPSHAWASDAIDRMLRHPSEENAVFSPFTFSNYLSLLSVSGGGLGGGREWGADEKGPGAGGYEGNFLAGSYMNLCPTDTATGKKFNLVANNLYIQNRWRGIVVEEDSTVRKTYSGYTVTSLYAVAARVLPPDSEAAKRYAWCADRRVGGYSARALQALCPPSAVAESASGEFADRVGSRWCYRADLSQPDSTFRVDVAYPGIDNWREIGDDRVVGFAIGGIGLPIGHTNRCSPAGTLANGIWVGNKHANGTPDFCQTGWWQQGMSIKPYHDMNLRYKMPIDIATDPNVVIGTQTKPTETNGVWSWTRDWSSVIGVFNVKSVKPDPRITNAVVDYTLDSVAKSLTVEDSLTVDLSDGLYLGWHFSPSKTPTMIDANTFEFTDGINTIRVTIEPLGDFEWVRTVRTNPNAWDKDGTVLPMEWHDAVSANLHRIAANVGYIPDRITSDNIYNVRTTIEVVQ